MRNQKFFIIYGIIFITLLAGVALFWQYNTQKSEPNVPSVPSNIPISSSPSSTSTIVSPVVTNSPTSSVMNVIVFFGSNRSPQGEECTRMYSVIREIPRTQAVARAALEELLKGPSQSEQDQGYYTSINSGVRVQKLGIEDGVARVDFSSRMEEGVGGSCKVTAIRSQVTQTLLQFPTIDEVIISVDGRIEDALQP